MAAHDYHPSCPHYDARQILHDGCGECLARSKNFDKWAAYADDTTWDKAWERAYIWNTGKVPAHVAAIGVPAALGHLSEAEMPILRTLWSFMVMLERRGVPLGTPLGRVRVTS